MPALIQITIYIIRFRLANFKLNDFSELYLGFEWCFFSYCLDRQIANEAVDDQGEYKRFSNTKIYSCENSNLMSTSLSADGEYANLAQSNAQGEQCKLDFDYINKQCAQRLFFILFKA